MMTSPSGWRYASTVPSAATTLAVMVFCSSASVTMTARATPETSAKMGSVTGVVPSASKTGVPSAFFFWRCRSASVVAVASAMRSAPSMVSDSSTPASVLPAASVL